jgi:hypothetical protein
MAEHRITEENPVRWDSDGLDFERCAALHNLIVERGWVQRGSDPALLNRTTWWECFGGDGALAEVAVKLDDTVISFLKLAWHGFTRDTSAPFHGFHRFNNLLSGPDLLFEFPLNDDDGSFSEKQQYLWLYSANGGLAPGHPLGLVFEQDSFCAMQHLSMDDMDITLNGRQTWVKLEEALECFLEMMDQGKVVATNDSYSGKQERIADWIMPSYTEQDLEDSLDALSALVTAVETRMPSPPSQDDFEIGLIDAAVPETSAMLPPNTFVRRFLERARKPRFTYLAPGFQIAHGQPFASVSVAGDMLRPIMLLQSSLPAHHDIFRTSWRDEYTDSPFHGHFQAIQDYPSGLYLTESNPYSPHPYEDGCKLLLPFAVGGHGWARTSDGALFGEKIRSQGETATPFATSTQLFQSGFNPFTKSHDVKLKHVLRRWTELVETEKWQVDGNGVGGGIEKWREADTEEHWEDYQLPMDW